MALFNTDFEAVIIIIILSLFLYLANKIATKMIKSSQKLTNEQKNKITFLLRAFSFFILIYLLIEGFPSFEKIDPVYSAILTGAISTALAFAMSEIFANLISGLLLILIDPFDIGHVVKVKDNKGIIRAISLTKIIIETFDGILIEISNAEILSSTIINYTINVDDIKRVSQLKHEINTPQDKGKARLDVEFDFEDILEKIEEEAQIRQIYEEIQETHAPMIHAYTFRMLIPYEGLRIKIDKLERLCRTYSETFGYKPQFHIIEFSNEITFKFRILTLDSKKLLDHQPKFAKDIYKIINSKKQ